MANAWAREVRWENLTRGDLIAVTTPPSEGITVTRRARVGEVRKHGDWISIYSTDGGAILNWIEGKDRVTIVLLEAAPEEPVPLF